MELFKPVQRIGNQEVAHLVAAKVENISAPVAVLAQARIGVFVQGSTVKARQREEVLGKVCRHPVKKHANAVLMTMIDKVAEVVRRAEAAGRRKIARSLVTPGLIQRMLADWHQLDMGVAHPLDVLHQTMSDFPIVEKTAGIVTLP